MRKLNLSVAFLAILLLAHCAPSGQPAPSQPTPGTSEQDKPGGVERGGSDM